MERAEVQALIKEELERSTVATRIRQLQGRVLPLPYLGTWTDFGGGQHPGQYVVFGRLVVVSGVVTKGGSAPAAGNVIARLPVVPVGEVWVPTVSGPAANTFGSLQLQTDGDLVWQVGSAAETDFTAFSFPFFASG